VTTVHREGKIRLKAETIEGAAISESKEAQRIEK